MLQNFNPINIDRKVDTEDEQLMIQFIWENCVPYEFAAEIYKSPNYQILAAPKLTFQKANQIVKKWIVSYDKKSELCKKIAENFKSIHYVYSCLYPKVYSRINQFGIKNKSEFNLEKIQYQKSFLLDTQENVLILKKTYEKLYNQISKQFNTTLNRMPFDLFKEIEDDFIRENYGVNDLTNLDNWVSFYFKHGRFPGNRDLTILPQTQLPKLIDQLSVEVSPVELYKKFGNGDAKSLVSFQAVIALFLYYGGEPIIAKKAMDEWKENLTFQALSKENNKITMKFDYLAEIVFYFLRVFLTLESEFEEHEKLKLEISNRTIDESTKPKLLKLLLLKKHQFLDLLYHRYLPTHQIV